MNDLLITIFGISFIFIMTSLGALMIYFYQKKTGIANSLFLGFAGGVMLAASFFSLLIPSFTYAEMINIAYIIPAFIGVLVGAIFILIFDIFISKKIKTNNDYKDKKLFLAMTLHNIPEGLSVGLTFGLALSNYDNISIISGLIFAIGIGIQNFPEGMALALPLETSTNSKKKAVFLTILSGMVEPIFAIIGVLLATSVVYVMPWALCFGAGSMIYVIIDELIVNTASSKEKRLTNLAFIIGFLVMMSLDLCL